VLPPASRSVCAIAWAEWRTSSSGKPEADVLGMRQSSTSVRFQWSRRASSSPSLPAPCRPS
jgi:hypothetical protein